MNRTSLLTRTAARTIQLQQRHNSAAPYQHILTEVKGNVGIITLNRPKFLNALCNALLDEVIDAGRKFDKNADVGCIIITGSDKAFAAGADIKEMSTMTFAQCYTENLFKNWTEVPKINKPVRILVAWCALICFYT
jgi:enoyl-CoA hydratase/carnithine racemase